MRRLFVMLGLILVIVLLWLTVAWVPTDGSLHAWNGSSGTLKVPDRGMAFLPRWSYRRLAGSRLAASVAASSSDGASVGVSVGWDPAPGTYRLSATEDLVTGLGDRAATPIVAVIQEVPLRCLVPETLADTTVGEEECPPDLVPTLAGQIASVIGAEAASLEVTLAPDPTAVRELLLATIAEEFGPPDTRVLVLALDGLDWDFVLPWVRAGDMPNLARLMDAGTWGRMETLVPTLSPLIWTTVATGVSPDRHGILDFVEKEPTRGILLPVTGRSRKVPAVWNLASAFGRSVGVVGWWASWPAERVRGTVVTDRLYYTLTQGISEAVFRSDPPEMVFPAERTAEIAALRDRAVKETDWQAVQYFMNIPEQQFIDAVAANRGMEDPVDGFRRILASTRTYLGAGLQLAGEKPDLLMVYLEGTDTLGHLLAPYMPPPTLDVDPAEAAVYVEAVPKYFQIVDRWIGRFLEHYPLSETAVLVVSDHGFKWTESRPRGLSGTAGPTAPLWHETDAVFVAAGRGIERRGELPRSGSANDPPASIYDVAPTVLALLGLPAGAGWEGSVLPGCPSPELQPIDYEPLVPPSSYQPQLADDATPVDPEFIAKLRSLGYLGGAPGSAPSPPAAAPSNDDEHAALDTSSATRGQLNNLAVVKINQKEYAEAERLLLQAIGLSPEYPSPHYNLRRIYMETQRYDDADRELWTAVSKGLRDPERTLDQAAKDYDDLDLQERSVALLTRAIERFPDHEPFWVHLLVVRIRLDQCVEGLELGRRGVVRFPGSAPVHAFHGLAAGCAGDLGTARSALERSLEINPDQEKLRRTLANLPPG
ncbi:MAG: hypothetical protein GY719_05395 [bacterium]|nr:hypothetical protein [bacterium]